MKYMGRSLCDCLRRIGVGDVLYNPNFNQTLLIWQHNYKSRLHSSSTITRQRGCRSTSLPSWSSSGDKIFTIYNNCLIGWVTNVGSPSRILLPSYNRCISTYCSEYILVHVSASKAGYNTCLLEILVYRINSVLWHHASNGMRSSICKMASSLRGSSSNVIVLTL